MNDFFGWLGKTVKIGENTTAFIIVVAALVVVSVMVGSLFGTAAKKKAQREEGGSALSVLELDLLAGPSFWEGTRPHPS